MVKILIKKLDKNIKIPEYKTKGSSGMDLAANVSDIVNIEPGKTAIIPTGLALSIPKGFEVAQSSMQAFYFITKFNALLGCSTISK